MTENQLYTDQFGSWVQASGQHIQSYTRHQ